MRMTADQKADFGAQIRTVRFEDLVWMQARIGLEITRKNEAIRVRQAKQTPAKEATHATGD